METLVYRAQTHLVSQRPTLKLNTECNKLTQWISTFYTNEIKINFHSKSSYILIIFFPVGIYQVLISEIDSQQNYSTL